MGEIGVPLRSPLSISLFVSFWDSASIASRFFWNSSSLICPAQYHKGASQHAFGQIEFRAWEFQPLNDGGRLLSYARG